MTDYAIVADIGGTNARFSRVDLTNLAFDNIAVYPCSHFLSIDKALVFYQQMHGLAAIKEVAIAIACPVMDDSVSMTNFHWQFSIKQLQQQLALNHLCVINDFTAAAMSLPVLASYEKVQIGQGQADPTKNMAILGAGTGLGVAHLIPTHQGYLPLAGEGGHTDWAAQNEQEWFIQRFLASQHGHVSYERILSGNGLENLYLALAAYQQQFVCPLNASDIATLALANQSQLACASVAQFFACLGSFAGNLALMLATFGGVYIAGGIVPKLLPLMARSDFRQRFETKGRFDRFNRDIATYVVTAEQPGLLGAAVYLKQDLVAIA